MITDMTPLGLHAVMYNLRFTDDREIKATLPLTREEHIARLAGLKDAAWEARAKDGVAVAIGGFIPLWPHVCTLWMFATPRFKEVSVEVTRFGRHVMLPALKDAGYHRVEVRALRSNVATARWLRLVGFRQEAVLAQLGQGREDFILFAWTPHATPAAPPS